MAQARESPCRFRLLFLPLIETGLASFYSTLSGEKPRGIDFPLPLHNVIAQTAHPLQPASFFGLHSCYATAEDLFYPVEKLRVSLPLCDYRSAEPVDREWTQSR